MPKASAPKAPWVAVAIAAHNGHAGQGEALFRADHVNNALAHIVDVKNRHPEVGAVLAQGFNLDARFLVINAGRSIGGRHIVIGHGQCFFRRP